jgi:hypothetical protein
MKRMIGSGASKPCDWLGIPHSYLCQRGELEVYLENSTLDLVSLKLETDNTEIQRISLMLA